MGARQGAARGAHAAFAGADTVVLNVAGETLAEQARNAIGAARAAGIRKVVLVSSSRASLDGPTESTRQHAIADEALRESGHSTNNVAQLTGHAPRSIQDFVRDELTRAVRVDR